MRLLTSLIALGALAAAPLTAAPAMAAGTTPFSITEDVAHGSFTATGITGCRRGTFEDDPRFAPHGDPAQSFQHRGGFEILIHTVYSCQGGDEFFALKHVFITFTDTGFTNTGPIQLLGGTGALSGLSGHGTDTGSNVNGVGSGYISGFLSGV